MDVSSLKHGDQLVLMNYFFLCTGTKYNGLCYLFFQCILITIFSFIFILSIFSWMKSFYVNAFDLYISH